PANRWRPVGIIPCELVVGSQSRTSGGGEHNAIGNLAKREQSRRSGDIKPLYLRWCGWVRSRTHAPARTVAPRAEEQFAVRCKAQSCFRGSLRRRAGTVAVKVPHHPTFVARGSEPTAVGGESSKAPWSAHILREFTWHRSLESVQLDARFRLFPYHGAIASV